MSGPICTKKAAEIMACLCVAICIFCAYGSIWASDESLSMRLFLTAFLSLAIAFFTSLIGERNKTFKERPAFEHLQNKETINEGIKYSKFLLRELDETRININRSRYFLEE